MDRLEEILLEHKDKIVFGLSAHDHLGALRSFKTDGGEFLMQLLISPSITMADGNQPSYSVINIDDETHQLDWDIYYFNVSSTYTEDINEVLYVFQNWDDLSVSDICQFHELRFEDLTPENIVGLFD
jgi:hypothetical protein